MIRLNHFIILIILLFSFNFPSILHASIPSFSLSEAIDLLIKNNLEIRESSKEIMRSDYDKDQIEGEFSPKLDIQLGIGPINKVTGDAIKSTTAKLNDANSWGTIIIGEIGSTLPLYTWGRKKNYLKAAIQGKKIKQAQLRTKKNEIIYKLKEIYYGNLYAHNLLDFVQGSIDDLEKIIKKVKQKKYSKKDYYRLKIITHQLKSKEQDLLKKYKVSQMALAYYVSSDSEKALPSVEWLELNKRTLKSFEHYKKLMFKQNSKVNQLNAGIEAKHHLSLAEAKANYPQIGLVAKYKFSHTGQRENQTSAFAYDPYNDSSFLLGIGITCNIDWGVTKSKVNKLKLDIVQLKLKKNNAQRGYSLLLKRKWLEIKKLELVVKNNSKARRFAKKWLSRSMMSGGLGLINTKDLAEAYMSRALTLKDYFESIYKYNLAWADFSKMIGIEVDPTLIKNKINN